MTLNLKLTGLSLIILLLSSCTIPTAITPAPPSPVAEATTVATAPAVTVTPPIPVTIILPRMTPGALANQFANTLHHTRIVVIENTNSVKLILPTYYIFINNKAINPRFTPYLDAILTQIKSIHYEKIDINAYTDTNTHLIAGRHLSNDWANQIAVYFSEHGIDQKKIIAKGYGEYHPLATNFTFAGRLQNRRVEIVIEL